MIKLRLRSEDPKGVKDTDGVQMWVFLAPKLVHFPCVTQFAPFLALSVGATDVVLEDRIILWGWVPILTCDQSHTACPK